MEYRQIWDPLTSAVSTRMIERVDDGAFIPINPANRDYRAFEQWLAEGNSISPPLPAPPGPAPLPEPDIREMEQTIRDIEERLTHVEDLVDVQPRAAKQDKKP